jgi:hypothetical protein
MSERGHEVEQTPAGRAPFFPPTPLGGAGPEVRGQASDGGGVLLLTPTPLPLGERGKTALLALLAALALGGTASAQPPAAAKPAELVLEDQFERRHDLAAYRGEVVVLVYGDRKGTDTCREFGEKLHVLFHPAAAGQPPAKARTAPVAALQGVPAGRRSPDVVVVPVAAAGNVPAVVRDLIRTQVAKASPEVPVWLDFSGVMEKEYGLRPGQPNLAVFDAAGRLRLKVNGTPDQPTVDKLVQTIQNLRAEAAGLGR